MNCRHCNSFLEVEFIDLVNSPPSNSFLSEEELNEPEVYYPLKVFVCEKCFLVQVDEYKKSSDIFNKDYAYFSSFSKSWLEHCRTYTEMMIGRFGFNNDSRIVEIASNDGYLLQYFNEKNIKVLGIEPTESTANIAKQKGIDTIVEFFGEKLARQLTEENKKADLLLEHYVLAHDPDINDFVLGLKILLKENGVITMEFPHLLQLVKYNQFDTIYHEHFSYLSLTTVKRIFESKGLSIFDVEEIPTHGGSLRIFAKHSDDQNNPILENVEKIIAQEIREGLTTKDYYKNFQKSAKQVKFNFLEFLLSNKNKKIAAYGAAAKGNTLLNFCGVKNDLIQFVVDASPFKQGKYLPGSHIPIVTEEQIKKYKPDFVVIFPWNIKKEIEEQLTYIRDWGGKFVIAVPELTIF